MHDFDSLHRKRAVELRVALLSEPDALLATELILRHVEQWIEDSDPHFEQLHHVHSAGYDQGWKDAKEEFRYDPQFETIKIIQHGDECRTA